MGYRWKIQLRQLRAELQAQEVPRETSDVRMRDSASVQVRDLREAVEAEMQL
jgi:hypothetical protein